MQEFWVQQRWDPQKTLLDLNLEYLSREFLSFNRREGGREGDEMLWCLHHTIYNAQAASEHVSPKLNLTVFLFSG